LQLAIEDWSPLLKIRVAIPADLDAVIACADKAFAEPKEIAPYNGARGNEDLLDQIHARNIYVICSQSHRGIVGYISLLHIRDHLFVDSLAVLPEYQGDGFGTQLLLWAEQEAARLGLTSVQLFTKQIPVETFAFYAHRGFTETDRCDSDGIARVFYRKDVAPRAEAVSASRSH
jgi:GNAT superfamily N-acetyltransferase